MRRAFTFLELIFVIIVIGILAKFGTNLMMTAYTAYAASTINNRLQVDAELALKQISNRLQYRIKDSVIARATPGGTFDALTSADANATILEWVGYDIDGWLGTNRAGIGGEPVFNRPTWSGVIDVDDAAAVAALSYLQSPGTDTTLANNVIQSIRANGSATGIANAAVFFTGANSDVQTDYGWDGSVQATQSTTAAHPITNAGAGSLSQLVDATAGPSTFTNTDVYENYKLAWTAYAIRIMDNDADGDNDLVLYYDYQPWAGEDFLNDGTAILLLPNVDTFKFSGMGDTIRLQVCVNEENSLGEGLYAICKETAIF